MPNSPALVLALTAHFIGDYYLQWQYLADKKRGHFPTLLLHSVLYALPLALMFMLVKLPWWVWVLLVVSHFVIDTLKWMVERKGSISSDKVYLADQFLHIAIILVVIGLLNKVSYKLIFEAFKPEFWRWLLVFVLIGKPANISFKVIFQRFSEGIKELSVNPKSEQAMGKSKSKPAESKPGAGAWIGILERVFVVIFSSAGQFAAFGLLMTAKSVARYEKISTDAAFAEYYLIGTLYSVLFALVAYLMVFQVIWPIPVDPTPILLVTPMP